MRRGRKKNTLLWRIFGISVLVHIVALPLLAHFGAFKKVEQHLMDTRLVNLPPPSKEAKREVKEPKKVARRTAATEHKAAGPAHHARQTAHQAPLNTPKVVASGGGPGGDTGGEPAVDANGTGKVGQLPAPAAGGGGGGSAGGGVALASNPAPKTQETAPAPAPAPTPQPKPAPPPAPRVAQAPPAPKPPVLTDVVPTYSPQPSIPDDLRGDALDKTFVAEFVVGADGTPTSVKVAQSTGIDELDRIALETAKQWKFKPAMRDGQPIESMVRLHIEFQVNG